jgi:Holliday junction resolvase RusA-like endonuclease
MSDTLKFTVEGTPIPQGSMRAFMPKNCSQPIVTSDNVKLKPWRKLVAQLANLEMRKRDYIQIGKNVPVRLILDFYFDKPKSVKMIDKITKPDLDKLVRSCGDSLTGIVYEDDSQVTEIVARKLYGSPARVEIEVQEADFPPTTLLESHPIRDEALAF